MRTSDPAPTAADEVHQVFLLRYENSCDQGYRAKRLAAGWVSPGEPAEKWNARVARGIAILPTPSPAMSQPEQMLDVVPTEAEAVPASEPQEPE